MFHTKGFQNVAQLREERFRPAIQSYKGYGVLEGHTVRELSDSAEVVHRRGLHGHCGEGRSYGKGKFQFQGRRFRGK